MIALIAYQATNLYLTISETSEYANFIFAIYNLTRAMGKERGYSTLAIGGTNIESLADVRADVDESFQRLQEIVDDKNTYKNLFSKVIAQEKEQFDEFRTILDSGKINHIEDIDEYAQISLNMLGRILEVSSIFGEVTSYGFAWYHYALGQEYVALQRETVSLMLSQGFFSPSLRARIIGYLYLENANRDLFFKITNFSSFRLEYETNELVIEATNVTGVVFDYVKESSVLNISIADPSEFFENITVLIDAFNDGSNLLHAVMIDSIKRHTNTLIIIFVGYVISTTIELVTGLWFLYITYPVLAAYGKLHGWKAFISKSFSKNKSSKYSVGSQRSKASK
jgi:hypothetical protein